jgi:hypothetical protein
MARPNPRRRIDQLAREAERVLAEQRDAVLPSDRALDQAAVVRRSDVDAAIDLFHEANGDHEIGRLLDGPAGESEQDG